MTNENLLREAQDPSTPAARLAELAQQDRTLWPALAANPSTYPGLLDWLGEHGDDTVKAAITARSSVAAPPVPPSIPAPPSAAPAAGFTPPTPAGYAAPLGATGQQLGYGGAAYAAPQAAPKSNKGLLIAIVAIVGVLLLGGGTWAVLAATGALGGGNTAAPTTTETTTETETTDTPTETTPPVVGGDFCALFEELSTLDTTTTDPAALQGFVDFFNRLDASAPPEAKEHTVVLADFMNKLSRGDTNVDFEAYIDAATGLATVAYDVCY